MVQLFDYCLFSGTLHREANNPNTGGQSLANHRVRVNIVAPGTLFPFHIQEAQNGQSNNLGWVSADTLRPETAPQNNNEINDLRNRVNNLQRELDGVKTQQQDTQNQRQQQEHRANNLQNEVNQARTEKSNAENRANNLQNELTQVRNQLQNELLSAKTECKNIKKQLEEQQNQSKKAEAQMNDLVQVERQKFEEEKKKLEEYEEANEKLKKDIAVLNKSYNDSQILNNKQVGDLMLKMEELKAFCDKAAQEKQLVEQLKQLQFESQKNLQIENQKLKEQIAEQEKNKKYEANQLLEFVTKQFQNEQQSKSQLESHNAKIIQLKAEINALKYENDLLKKLSLQEVPEPKSEIINIKLPQEPFTPISHKQQKMMRIITDKLTNRKDEVANIICYLKDNWLNAEKENEDVVIKFAETERSLVLEAVKNVSEALQVQVSE
ncbi:Hypothetical_protein [Hexamita inflata]|uniref:Hypothetical_protein n=1 Tax=Hexamita inflata TaxID=28002 RepID=A0AA86UN47_9EUKA|nr:Hypothetical protein HINF_LOCUS45647 [Hexamita inflata]